MTDLDWQTRARMAGLTQRQLARLVGLTDGTLSKQLTGRWPSGISPSVKTVVMCWEHLGPDAKAEILASLDQ